MFNRIRAVTDMSAVAAVLILATVAPAFIPQAESQVAWKRLSPPVSPSARAFSAMAYDPVSKKIVLFSGYDGKTYPKDTWTFDGTTWIRQKTTASPSGRAGASMAFDRVTHKLVLFGGFDGANYLGDTWLWDGSTSSWTHAHPKSSPKAVTGPMLFTDPKNGHADQFGGFDGKFYQFMTWRWNGSNWVQLHPTNAPGARSIAVAALDSARKMLFSLADWAM